MVFESVRGYVQLASGLSELTRARATEAARGLLSLQGAGIETGGKLAVQVSALAEELLAAATANRHSLRALVRSEADAAVNRIGLVPAEQLQESQAELAALRAELAALRSTSSRATSTKKTARPPSRKVGAKKTAATKAAAKASVTKTPAKKAAAKASATKASATKASATKTAAKKAAAKKSATKKSAVKKSAVKKTSAVSSSASPEPTVTATRPVAAARPSAVTTLSNPAGA